MAINACREKIAWMASIMRVCVRRNLSLLTLLLWLFSPNASAESFAVIKAQIDHIGNAHVFSGQISYPLTPRVKEALHNGVPITFEQEFELIDSTPILGYWHWDDVLWNTTLRFQLRFHALTQQYILESLETRHSQSFTSLESALRIMGEINNLPLPPRFTEQTDDLVFRVRSGIDLNALPTPMRPGALVSSKWQLDSPWKDAVWR
jgi:hypothetical protein